MKVTLSEREVSAIFTPNFFEHDLPDLMIFMIYLSPNYLTSTISSGASDLKDYCQHRKLPSGGGVLRQSSERGGHEFEIYEL